MTIFLNNINHDNNKFKKPVMHCDLIGACQRVVVTIFLYYQYHFLTVVSTTR